MAMLLEKMQVQGTGQPRFALRGEPMGYVDGMDAYEFVEDNPIAGIDPAGLKVVWTDKSHSLMKDHPFAGGFPMWIPDTPFEQRLQVRVDSNRTSNCCSTINVIIVVGTSPSNSDLGHVGVGVDGSYYDYGPQAGAQAGASPFGTPGGGYWMQQYGNLGDLVKNIKEKAGDDAAYELTARVSADQAASVKKYWENLLSNPSTFCWLGGNTCYTTALASLKAGDVSDVETPIPADTLNALKEKLVNSCGPDAGKPATLTKLN